MLDWRTQRRSDGTRSSCCCSSFCTPTWYCSPVACINLMTIILIRLPVPPDFVVFYFFFPFFYIYLQRYYRRKETSCESDYFFVFVFISRPSNFHHTKDYCFFWRSYKKWNEVENDKRVSLSLILASFFFLIEYVIFFLQHTTILSVRGIKLLKFLSL